LDNKKSGLDFPNLRKDTEEKTSDNTRNTEQILTPLPCKFIDASLPACSVLRPSSTANPGAVAAASGLAASGLFAGQPTALVDAVVALAMAADAAARGSG